MADMGRTPIAAFGRHDYPEPNELKEYDSGSSDSVEHGYMPRPALVAIPSDREYTPTGWSPASPGSGFGDAAAGFGAPETPRTSSLAGRIARQDLEIRQAEKRSLLPRLAAGAFLGAAGGGAAGAAVGTVFGGIGALPGAVGGMAVGALVGVAIALKTSPDKPAFEHNRDECLQWIEENSGAEDFTGEENDRLKQLSPQDWARHLTIPRARPGLRDPEARQNVRRALVMHVLMHGSEGLEAERNRLIELGTGRPDQLRLELGKRVWARGQDENIVDTHCERVGLEPGDLPQDIRQRIDGVWDAVHRQHPHATVNQIARIAKNGVDQLFLDEAAEVAYRNGDIEQRKRVFAAVASYSAAMADEPAKVLRGDFPGKRALIACLEQYAGEQMDHLLDEPRSAIMRGKLSNYSERYTSKTILAHEAPASGRPPTRRIGKTPQEVADQKQRAQENVEAVMGALFGQGSKSEIRAVAVRMPEHARGLLRSVADGAERGAPRQAGPDYRTAAILNSYLARLVLPRLVTVPDDRAAARTKWWDANLAQAAEDMDEISQLATNLGRPVRGDLQEASFWHRQRDVARRFAEQVDVLGGRVSPPGGSLASTPTDQTSTPEPQSD